MPFGLTIVRQFEKMVVLRWGRLQRVSNPGLRFVVPFMEDGRKVDIRERVQRVPTQKYITSDNVVVDMDFVIYYRVIEESAEQSVLNVQNFEAAVVNLSLSTLRAVIGSTSLASALAEREKVRDALQIRLDEVTGRWGVKVSQVEINEIDPPPGVKAAMEREKSAAAIKTADITESEGKRQAAINRAEGEKRSAILEAEGGRGIGDSGGRRRPPSRHPASRGFQHRPRPHLRGGLEGGQQDHELAVFRGAQGDGFQPLHQVHIPHGVHIHVAALPEPGRRRRAG